MAKPFIRKAGFWGDGINMLLLRPPYRKYSQSRQASPQDEPSQEEPLSVPQAHEVPPSTSPSSESATTTHEAPPGATPTKGADAASAVAALQQLSAALDAFHAELPTPPRAADSSSKLPVSVADSAAGVPENGPAAYIVVRPADVPSDAEPRVQHSPLEERDFSPESQETLDKWRAETRQKMALILGRDLSDVRTGSEQPSEGEQELSEGQKKANERLKEVAATMDALDRWAAQGKEKTAARRGQTPSGSDFAGALAATWREDYQREVSEARIKAHEVDPDTAVIPVAKLDEILHGHDREVASSLLSLQKEASADAPSEVLAYDQPWPPVPHAEDFPEQLEEVGRRTIARISAASRWRSNRSDSRNFSISRETLQQCGFNDDDPEILLSYMDGADISVTARIVESSEEHVREVIDKAYRVFGVNTPEGIGHALRWLSALEEETTGRERRIKLEKQIAESVKAGGGAKVTPGQQAQAHAPKHVRSGTETRPPFTY